MSGSRTEKMFKVILVAGARPNFMKVAPIIKEMGKFPEIEPILVHTGQHYDDSMSESFFRDLNLPRPDIYLGVGSATHAVQTADIMKLFEPVLLERQPDVVIVVGDVNSTVACALVASKIQYPSQQHSSTTQRQHSKGLRPLVAHIEAGLRSFDRTMPEEINRILTDQLSDFLFVSEQSGLENLKNEGFRNFLNAEDLLEFGNNSTLNTQHSLPLVAFVGNTMIDTLLKHVEKARQSNILEKMGLINSQLKTQNSNLIPYGVLTLHRPSNVDNKESFQNILGALLEVSRHIPIIFPAHPRTLNRIKEFHFEKYFRFIAQPSNLQPQTSGILFSEPLSYLDFLSLMMNAKLVFTDSGGIQEETTILGIPCLTIRENTERPITVYEGTNVVVGNNREKIIEESFKAINNVPDSNRIPALWDGKSAQRVVRILLDQLEQRDREPKM